MRIATSGIIVAILLIALGAYGQSGAGATTTLQFDLDQARQAESRSDFSSAAEFYREAVRLMPGSAEVWANLGLMDYETGASEEAIRSFMQSTKLDSSLFAPQLFLGIEYFKLHKARAALSYLKHAEHMHPNDPQAALYLARVYASTGDSTASIAMYEKLTELNPKSTTAWFELGTTLLQQVELDARIMTSRYPTSPYEQLRAAEVLTGEGKPIQADRYYRSALRSAVPLSCARAEFGINLLKEGEASRAQDQFERDLQSYYPCGIARLGIAVLHVLNGQMDSAEAEFKSIADADSAFVMISLPLFRGIIPAGKLRELVDHTNGVSIDSNHSQDLDGLIEDSLSNAGTSQVLGIQARLLKPNSHKESVSTPAELYSVGRYGECDRVLRSERSTAKNLSPLLVQCSYYAGDFYTTAEVAGQLKLHTQTEMDGLYWEAKADDMLAREALSKAAILGGDAPEIHLMLGDVLRVKHQWTQAEREYRKVLAVDPKNSAARLGLAITLFSEFKLSEALQLDKSLLSDKPDNPEANLLAAEILVENQEFEAASPYLRHCADVSPELASRVHVLQGKILAATGHLQGAAKQLVLGASSDQDGSVHYQLARIYQKLGEQQAAKAAFQESEALRSKADNSAH
jgi:predicted Zn-dependent protease